MDKAVETTKSCGLAVWSLVLGILSLVCCAVFTGIPAIICGHMAQSRINRSEGTLSGKGLATGGLVTGYIGTVLTSVAVLGILAGMLLPAVAAARERARRVQCMNNLSQIGKYCEMYATDHGKAFPPDFKALVKSAGRSPRLFVCPATGKQPGDISSVDQWSDYVLVPNRTEDDPADAVLAFSKPECFRGEGGNVLTVDGSVRWCETDEYDKLTVEFRH